MGRYRAKNKDKINAARRLRYQRQKLVKSPSTPKKQRTKKERQVQYAKTYYYSHHEKCKEYQRNYAKANYRKNREKILARKRLKCLSQKIDCKKPKEIVIDLKTCQSIPFIVTCNARPEDKLSAIANLL